MNNKTILLLKDINTSKLGEFISPTEEESSFIEKYINIQDYFKTMRESFYMTEFNFYQIFDNFIVHSDDRLTRNTKQPFNDFCVINSLVANYLAVSKMFIDLVEKFDSPSNSELNTFISEIYNNNFYYCLMSTLRNFTLHGHLPVYYFQNRYSFNLDYILVEGEKFKFSKSGKMRIKDTTSKIFHHYQLPPNISLSVTIIEYHKLLFDIFIKFFEVNRLFLEGIQTKMDLYINKHLSEVKNDTICININNSSHVLIVSDLSIEVFEHEYKSTKVKLDKYIERFVDKRKGGTYKRIKK